jgi:hypothetical protein
VTREPQFWPWVMATISLHMYKTSISEDINCLGVWRILSSLKCTMIKLRLLSCNWCKPTHILFRLDQTPIHTTRAIAKN